MVEGNITMKHRKIRHAHSEVIRALLIEDNPGDARLIGEMLAEAKDVQFDLECVKQLAEGFEYLAAKGTDVILLDLSLPDSWGLDTFIKLQARAAEVPIIVLTGTKDETVAVKAVYEGAQDYLVKGQVNSSLLVRAARYAIERKRAEDQLRKYRVHLEELVKERTAQLSTANEQLQREVTDRKLAEDSTKLAYTELNQIFDVAADGLCVINKENKVVRINETLCTLLGISREEAVSKNCREVLRDSICDTPGCPMAKILNGQERVECDVELEDKSGAKIPCILTATPFRGPAGELLGLVENFKDISERKKMEEELQKAQKLESIGILAGGIAHDFNNFLTAIGGSISLAKLYLKPTDKISEILTRGEKAALRAKDLTRQLLTFSRGGAPIKKTTKIKKLLHDIAGFSLSGSKAKYELSLPEDLWPVEIDEGQISQVINNIMINAEQALPEGGVIKVWAENITVSAQTKVPLSKGKYLKIAIKDQGQGITVENLKKIFDPFFTTKSEGSGLGLAIAYSTMKRHGGYILAESQVGVGTTFYIYLPAPDKEILAEREIEKRLYIGHGRILLMDDDQDLRDIAGLMLDHLGYEAEFAVDGAEAIKVYQKAKESGRPFDAVIMDLTIPGGMGGVETIHELLKIAPDIKAIVSSGYSNDPVMSEFSKYGFSDVVLKPYEITDLSGILHKVIRG